jgi:hypothetical protein
MVVHERGSPVMTRGRSIRPSAMPGFWAVLGEAQPVLQQLEQLLVCRHLPHRVEVRLAVERIAEHAERLLEAVSAKVGESGVAGGVLEEGVGLEGLCGHAPQSTRRAGRAGLEFEAPGGVEGQLEGRP